MRFRCCRMREYPGENHFVEYTHPISLRWSRVDGETGAQCFGLFNAKERECQEAVRFARETRTPASRDAVVLEWNCAISGCL